jgi:hypothetical protein
MDVWTETVKLRLELNDAACGIAAEDSWNAHHYALYEHFSPVKQATMSVSCIKIAAQECLARTFAIYAFAFLILHIFWLTFFSVCAVDSGTVVDALKTKYSWLEAGSKQSHGRQLFTHVESPDAH